MGMFFGDHKISSFFFNFWGGGVCLIFLFLGVGVNSRCMKKN